MARLLKSDGTDREVKPQGPVFTSAEVEALVNGCITGLNLNYSGSALPFVEVGTELLFTNYSGADQHVNQAATALVQKIRPDLGPGITVYGDVLVATLSEVLIAERNRGICLGNVDVKLPTGIKKGTLWQLQPDVYYAEVDGLSYVVEHPSQRPVVARFDGDIPVYQGF